MEGDAQSAAHDRRIRPLLIAEMANPEWVSVPLEGWSLATAIAGVTDAHIVTQIRNRDAFLRAGLVEGRDFTAIDSEKMARPVNSFAQKLRMGKGVGWTTVMATKVLSYPYFERKVWEAFRSRLAGGEFDLVHRITPLSPTLPSSLSPRCRRIGVPFLLGPLNGGLPWPRDFDAERRREKEWLSYVRGAYRLMPGARATLDSAAAIIAGSRHTEGEIPARHRAKCVYIPENAIDPRRFTAPLRQGVSAPLRCCFVGRLVPYKCPDILIAAAAPLLAGSKLKLDIVGDGPMRAGLEAQARALGVAEAVTFHGNVPHAEVQRILGAADIFGFPSVREFGGAVVLEAMALGVVPIIVDYGGPGEHVTPETGFAEPLGTRDDILRSFRTRLESLVADPSRLPHMSEAARARVGDRYTWGRKAEQVVEVYRWVLGERPERPDPFGSA
jgi:glycosyltransferase involved in cell wall biosynthesis